MRNENLNALAFARRLHKILDLDDIATADRPATIADAAGVSQATARRWLAGKCLPRSHTPISNLCEALTIHVDWISKGEGPEPTLWRRFQPVLDFYRNADDWTRERWQRMLIRLRNKDAKVYRLHDRFMRGEITQRQFLEAM